MPMDANMDAILCEKQRIVDAMYRTEGQSTQMANGGGGTATESSTQSQNHEEQATGAVRQTVPVVDYQYTSKIDPQRPLVDIVVTITALPSLIIFALLLESNMRNSWADETASRWTVLGLSMGLLIVALIICGYVTHRMGVCIRPQADDPTDAERNIYDNHVNADDEFYQVIDIMPPSYEMVMECDLTPPAYETVVNEKAEYINRLQQVPQVPPQEIAMFI